MPVVANVLAEPISDPQEIVKRLVEQVTGTVRWRECAAIMAGAGVTTFFEIGSGKVLTGLLKRIAEGATGTRHRHAGRCRGVQGCARLKTERRTRRTPMFDLTGKTALVTGATGGIGGAIARALHAQGAKVAVSGTRREALDALAAELGGASGAAVRSRQQGFRSRRWFPTPRRRWASSISSSTTPASPRTACSSR